MHVWLTRRGWRGRVAEEPGGCQSSPGRRCPTHGPPRWRLPEWARAIRSPCRERQCVRDREKLRHGALTPRRGLLRPSFPSRQADSPACRGADLEWDLPRLLVQLPLTDLPRLRGPLGLPDQFCPSPRDLGRQGWPAGAELTAAPSPHLSLLFQGSRLPSSPSTLSQAFRKLPSSASPRWGSGSWSESWSPQYSSPRCLRLPLPSCLLTPSLGAQPESGGTGPLGSQSSCACFCRCHERPVLAPQMDGAPRCDLA